MDASRRDVLTTLQEIERRNPEWGPWLDELGELLAELDNPQWDAAVPQRGDIDPARAPLPLLHACRRRWGVPRDWARSTCPICGAWPGFAELCGVERSRYLRCVRCGAAWRAHGLACVFCGTRDHAALGSLVAEEGAPGWSIEVCNPCKGYLKVFTTLRPGPAEQVLLRDLASVELDIAAGLRGYRRP